MWSNIGIDVTDCNLQGYGNIVSKCCKHWCWKWSVGLGWMPIHSWYL